MSGPSSSAQPLDRRAIATLTAFWIVATIAVRPQGAFPLGDDWSYAWAVRTLIERHRWQLTDFTSMPLWPQVLWGALFCWPFGFSFAALRLSTMIAAWSGTIGLFALARECGAKRPLALVAAFTLAVNPIYFALSYTFMTDVPFAAVAIWGFVFVVRYLTHHRPKDYAVALVLLTAATSIRQIGLTLAAGAGVGVWLDAPRRWKWAIALPAASAFALVAYRAVLGSHVPEFYSLQTQALIESLAEGPVSVGARFVRRCGQVFVYTGVFLFPFVIATRHGWLLRLRTHRPTRLIAVTLAGAVGCISVLAGLRMPLSGNILGDITLMPIIMGTAGFRPRAPSWVWIMVTMAGILAASILMASLVTRLGQLWTTGHAPARASAIVAALGCSLLFYLSPFLISGLYDRYLLPLVAVAIPLFIALGAGLEVMPSFPRPDRPALVPLALIGMFSVAGMHDTFELNRARWAAVDAALAEGIGPSAIDGGFEVNGWLSYDPDAQGRDNHGWWEAKSHPAARIELAPVEGFEIDRSFSFRRWLPWQRADVLLLLPARAR